MISLPKILLHKAEKHRRDARRRVGGNVSLILIAGMYQASPASIRSARSRSACLHKA